jgi:aminoglycoside phosphotransferase (APT) family kinase protein
MDQRLSEADISLTSTSVGNANYTFVVDKKYVVKLEKNKNWTSDWQEEMYRETEVLKLLEESDVNIPRIIDEGEIDGRYFRIMEYSVGENLDKYSGGRDFHRLEGHDKISISRRLGETLGEIHDSQSFNRFGLIRPGNELKISDSTWSEGISNLQEWWMKKLREYGYDETADKTEKICDEYSEFLDERNDSTLLHMEFDLRNVLVQKDEIVVLDWETAAAGDPLWDIIISESRIFWLSEESQKYQKAFREGYRGIRSINCNETAEKLYELFQMTRLLVIFSEKEDTKQRINARIDSLSTQL